jgi:hypothetical protein
LKGGIFHRSISLIGKLVEARDRASRYTFYAQVEESNTTLLTEAPTHRSTVSLGFSNCFEIRLLILNHLGSLSNLDKQANM